MNLSMMNKFDRQSAVQLGAAVERLFELSMTQNQNSVRAALYRRRQEKEDRRAEVGRRVNNALTGGLTLGGVSSIVSPGTVAEVGKRKLRRKIIFNKAKGLFPRRIRIGGGTAGLLAGALIGASLPGKKKLELARGLVHAYLLEAGPARPAPRRKKSERIRNTLVGAVAGGGVSTALPDELARIKMKRYSKTGKLLKTPKIIKVRGGVVGLLGGALAGASIPARERLELAEPTELGNDWKTIKQREDERDAARRWKRRSQSIGGGAALITGSLAIGDPGMKQAASEMKKAKIIPVDWSKGDVAGMKQHVQNQTNADRNLLKNRISRAMSHVPKGIKVGAAIAGIGGLGALASKVVERHHQKAINRRRKANAEKISPKIKTRLSEIFGKEVTFFRTREENPLSSLNPSGMVSAANYIGQFKKASSTLKKQVRAARKTGEFARDVVKVAREKGIGSGLAKVSDRARGKEVDNWRIGRETRSSVRLYRDAKPRTRRNKYWWEKKANRDKMAAVGISGAFVGGLAVNDAVKKGQARAVRKMGGEVSDGRIVRHPVTASGKAVSSTKIAAETAKEAIKAPFRSYKRQKILKYRRQLQNEFPNFAKTEQNLKVMKGPPPPEVGGQPNPERLAAAKRIGKAVGGDDALGERLLRHQQSLAGKKTKHYGGEPTHKDVKANIESLKGLQKKIRDRSPHLAQGGPNNPITKAVEKLVEKSPEQIADAMNNESVSRIGYRRKGGGNLKSRVLQSHFRTTAQSTAKMRKKLLKTALKVVKKGA